jgi:hypothetical protein
MVNGMNNSEHGGICQMIIGKNMKETKEQVEKAMFIVAEKLDILESIKKVYDFTGIYETCRIIVFRMFLKNYSNYWEKDDEVFKSVEILRKYCQDMFNKGSVDFNVSDVVLTKTKAEKYAVGYCETCDTPNHKETLKDCDKCNGYTHYTQND